MLIIYIIIAVETVALATIGVWTYLFVTRTNERLNERLGNVERKVTHLSTISRYFPDFIEKGEKVTRNISEELSMKQDVLTKLISEAEKASEKLGIVEEKIKENKLSKDTINKVLILVNQGFTPAEIAPKLNIPLGEIELVIKLRKYISSPIKEKL